MLLLLLTDLTTLAGHLDIKRDTERVSDERYHARRSVDPPTDVGRRLQFWKQRRTSKSCARNDVAGGTQTPEFNRADAESDEWRKRLRPTSQPGAMEPAILPRV